MIVQMEKTPNSKSRERAQQLFNKTIELEKKRQKSQQARIPSDPNAWYQIRENYEAIILEDHAFSEQHNIEFSLWQLHYKRIEEFRTHLHGAQNASRSTATNGGRGPPQPDRIAKIRVQLKAFLSEATGFYHDLMLKIRAKYGLPLGHFSDDSDNQTVVGTDSAKSSDAKKGLVSCHRCLIYLGDLARYKGLYGEGESRAREYSAASSYYLQAAALWPSNGNPHHQLAILATYSGDELAAVYRYFRSLASEIPFSTAKDNLVTAFEKNRQSYTQHIENTKNAADKEVGKIEKYKEFCTQFVRLHGILFTRTSLETFTTHLSSVTGSLHDLLASGSEEQQCFGKDGVEKGLAILRVVSILIFTVHNVNKKNEGQTYAEILQHTVLFENACSVAFEVMNVIVERCLQLDDPSSSFLIPCILVFLEWLACCPDVVSCSTDDKKPTRAKLSFWKHCIALLNKLLSSQLALVDDDEDETCFTNMSRYEEGEIEYQLALSEDIELRGFVPLLPAQKFLNFSRKHSNGVAGSIKEKRSRFKRIVVAGKALISMVKVDQQEVVFDSKMKKFVVGPQPQVCMVMPANVVPAESFDEKEMTTSVQENVEHLFGEDEDEEIVFRPSMIEKQMDAIAVTWNSTMNGEHVTSAPMVTHIPLHQATSNVPFHGITGQHLPPFGRNALPSDNVTKQYTPAAENIAPQHYPVSDTTVPQRHPMMDLHTSSWLVDQQAFLSEGIKKLRFAENGHVVASETKVPFGVPDGTSFLPPQPPSASFTETANYTDHKRVSEGMIPSKAYPSAFSGSSIENLAMKSSLISGTTKSQVSRPVRHLGPPPGFNSVPPKHVNMQVSNLASTNGSATINDYRWLDGYQMPSSTSSVGPNLGGNLVPLGNMQFMGSSNGSMGSSGMPFPGMQHSAAQFQGGNLKPYPGYQSFQNSNPNHGPNVVGQHVFPENQFSSQSGPYQGQSSWAGPYRV